MVILITGGTGLIGTELTKLLLANGHTVRYLSRKKTLIKDVEVFEYDYSKNYLEANALDNVEVVVHLAGAGIADKPWSESRKTELVESRTKTLELISSNIKNHSLKAIIGCSAIGYYGGDTGEILKNETSVNGNDFLANCTRLWENSEEDFAKKHSLRLVKIRTGVVLSTVSGALPKLIMPIKFNMGAALGSGKQWISWIHITDIAAVFYAAITDVNQTGVINGVAPNPVTNTDFNKIAAVILNKFYFLPNVPRFLLKLFLGEMSVVVLGSSKVENQKPLSIKLQFPDLENALENLLN